MALVILDGGLEDEHGAGLGQQLPHADLGRLALRLVVGVGRQTDYGGGDPSLGDLSRRRDAVHQGHLREKVRMKGDINGETRISRT